MVKVAVTDYSFPSLDVESAILEPLGCQLIARKAITNASDLIPLVADADHVITQFAPVNAEVIGAMQKAKVIVRYGVGVDNVDLEAARAKGIPVCNVPDYCLNEVADQTLALLLAGTRHIVANDQSIRQGKWGLAVPLASMHTLRDLTVGVVGAGRIGREVIQRLLSFKCKVLVHDPVVRASAIEGLGCEPVALDDLLSRADVVTLHLPSTAQTRKLINQQRLAMMRPGVIFINVSRGDLVESAALVEALQRGHVAFAGLDVFDPEPIPKDHPLLGLPNAVVAPHCASTSVRAVRTLRESVANAVVRSIRGELQPNVVNGVVASR